MILTTISIDERLSQLSSESVFLEQMTAQWPAAGQYAKSERLKSTQFSIEHMYHTPPHRTQKKKEYSSRSWQMTTGYGIFQKQQGSCMQNSSNHVNMYTICTCSCQKIIMLWRGEVGNKSHSLVEELLEIDSCCKRKQQFPYGYDSLQVYHVPGQVSHPRVFVQYEFDSNVFFFF